MRKQDYYLLSVMLVLSFSLPVRATTLYEFELVCPVDETRFTLMDVGSTTTMGRRADLSTYGMSGALYHGNVHSCPVCHFSGTEEDFKQTLSETLKQRVKTEFMPFLDGMRLSALDEADLTIQMYLWQARPAHEIAGVALAASYIAGEREWQVGVWNSGFLPQRPSIPNSRRRYFQALTARYLAQAWETEAPEPERRAIYAYLVGEMNRRLSRFHTAGIWFDRALAQTEQAEFRTLIETQMKHAREHNADDSL